ncbi:hypothetical protein CVT24_002772 [Panaeolus cyanescens]|uniref:Phosphoglycerate mutase n=1 Tax=Panaeolus cyanescens TaxID=181874 RepID=A0A409VNB4_9AGAR|nr:hypothetical protein CVT24_002772 [Panaeolus cyanescens]
MLTITFIRHGESEDNLLPIWAGWRDAPLSRLGRMQAAALGQSFASTHITAIYSSDLKRAHSTARAIQQHQSPTPPINVLRDLREMNFGLAEGNPWQVQGDTTGMSMEQIERLCSEQNVFFMIYERDIPYPEGESLNDVARRADKVIREFVLRHLVQPLSSPGVPASRNQHIALTSHGLCIGELIPALLRLDPEAPTGEYFADLRNTAWFRAVVQVRHDYPTDTVDAGNLPPLRVTITHRHQIGHYQLIRELVPGHDGRDGARAETHALSHAF